MAKSETKSKIEKNGNKKEESQRRERENANWKILEKFQVQRKLGDFYLLPGKPQNRPLRFVIDNRYICGLVENWTDSGGECLCLRIRNSPPPKRTIFNGRSTSLGSIVHTAHFLMDFASHKLHAPLEFRVKWWSGGQPVYSTFACESSRCCFSCLLFRYLKIRNRQKK